MYLMHRDITVARILQKCGRLSVAEIYNLKHMPVGTRNPQIGTVDQRFNIWYEERTIPQTRPNYTEILKAAKVGSIYELTSVSPMCSLTDCYWFREESDAFLEWADVNYYKNGFDSNIAEVLIDGSNVVINNFNSPDLTTNGYLPKKWIQGQDGKFYLIKGAMTQGREAVYNEVFASRLAQRLGLNSVPYMIYRDPRTGIVYSVCPSFIENDNEELVTLKQRAYEFGRTRKNEYEYLHEIGLWGDTDENLLLDSIDGNTDRHDGNIGEIRDATTLRVKRAAPIHDNGECMPYDRANRKNITPIAKLFNNDHSAEITLIEDFSKLLNSGLSVAELRELVFDVYGECYDSDACSDLADAAADRFEMVLEKAIEVSQNIDQGIGDDDD